MVGRLSVGWIEGWKVLVKMSVGVRHRVMR